MGGWMFRVTLQQQTGVVRARCLNEHGHEVVLMYPPYFELDFSNHRKAI